MDASIPSFFANRLKDFAEFSVKLEGLFTQYNIPGDKYLNHPLALINAGLRSHSAVLCLVFCFSEIKLKLFASLQWLGKDLQQMSQLPR